MLQRSGKTAKPLNLAEDKKQQSPDISPAKPLSTEDNIQQSNTQTEHAKPLEEQRTRISSSKTHITC